MTKREALQLPAWSTWSGRDAEDRARKLGRRWAAEPHTELGVDLVPVPAGSLVFVSRTSDLNAARPGFRSYRADAFLAGVSDTADSTDHAKELMAQSCWGGLALLTGSRRKDTLTAVQARVRAVLRCWDQLAAVSYVDADVKPVSLDQMVASWTEGLLAMWLDKPGPDLRADLETALSALGSAGPEERSARMITRLRELALTNPRIRHRDTMSDPAFLRTELAEMEPSEHEAIAVGSSSDALRFLYGTDRYLPDE